MVSNKSVYSGLYSDGKTATAYDVHVQFADKELVLTAKDQSFSERWVYKKITSSKPLRRHDTSQIGFKDLSDARLYISDTLFSNQLLPYVPHLTQKAERRRVVYPLLFIFAVLGLLGYILFFVLDFQPAKRLAYMLPDSIRQSIGKNVIVSLTKNKKVCKKNDQAEIALKKIINRLNSANNENNTFHIIVHDLGIVNAFAAPGEHIVIGRELIEFAKSPEEVAAVIAHEMGHGIKRHPETALVRALGLSTALLLFAGGDPGTVTNFGNLLLQLKYARDAEREADAIALDILKKAQISSKPMANFFDRMRHRHEKKDKNKNKDKDKKSSKKIIPQLPNILSTHPSTPERIKAIEKVKPWVSKALLSDKEWRDLRKICRAKTKPKV